MKDTVGEKTTTVLHARTKAHLQKLRGYFIVLLVRLLCVNSNWLKLQFIDKIHFCRVLLVKVRLFIQA